MALRETQTRFYALDLKNLGENFSVDDGFNLLRLPVKTADADGSLQFIASTFNPTDQVIYPGLYPGGRRSSVLSACWSTTSCPCRKSCAKCCK